MSRRLSRAAGLPLALSLAGAPAVLAHDFWIEPSTFTPEAGSTLQVRLRVGERFEGDSVPRNSARIDWFKAFGPGWEAPVDGAPGAEPAGGVRVERPGTLVIGYRGRPAYLEIEAGKFESYLKEEGLERIIALRAQRGESGRRSRELYSRSAKSILTAPGGPPGGHDRVVGLRLELVIEDHPRTLVTGGGFGVRLLFEGGPLAGAQVVAMPRGAPEERQAVVSGAAGRARFRALRPGAWLVKAVHMIEAADRSRADWESLWASLTFEVPAGGGAERPRP